MIIFANYALNFFFRIGTLLFVTNDFLSVGTGTVLLNLVGFDEYYVSGKQSLILNEQTCQNFCNSVNLG